MNNHLTILTMFNGGRLPSIKTVEIINYFNYHGNDKIKELIKLEIPNYKTSFPFLLRQNKNHIHITTQTEWNETENSKNVCCLTGKKNSRPKKPHRVVHRT